MQLFAIVLAFVTSAGAVPGAPPGIAYHICNFQASCIHHSAQCLVAFNVWQYGSFETPPGVECGGITFSQPDGTMANLLNGRCNLSSREFNLTFCDRGATLRVTGPVSIATNLTGETLLPLSNWKLEKNNMATVMSYHGPAELELAVV